jgi:dipeptidyl aminopeptidase/acylaminoacyl peptidase
MRYAETALVALLVSAPMAAQAASDTAMAFGARESVQQVSLSPDGTHVAIIEPLAGRGSAVRIATLVGGDSGKIILTSSGDPDRLQRCDWITEKRLACEVYMISSDSRQRLGYTRSVALNADGSAMKQLSASINDEQLGIMQNGGSILDLLVGDVPGSILMTRDFIPEVSTGTLTAQKQDGLGVEAVDATSLARRTIERGLPDAVDYISDGHGTVRIMGIQSKTNTGYSGNKVHYVYRKSESREWLPLGDLEFTPAGLATGFNPYAVDRDLNVVYGMEAKDGRDALYSIALDGSLKKSLVLANPAVKIDDVIKIGRQHRVVGATFATDRRQREYFDSGLRKLADALGKALPGLPLISFLDASADESKLLLFAGSDQDPGHIYLYDKSSHKLGEVATVRPQLNGIALASVKAITFPAADGTQIPAYLTIPAGSDGKNLPALVMPHGGPGARDEWGFDWLSQFFAARGFAVLQPNFRGSAGYGSDWFQQNGFRSWKTAIGDVNDGGRWLMAQGIAAQGKLAIFGWSYGGYAALQSSVLDPDLFKAIVAVAPVTDLDSLREESRLFMNYKLVDSFVGYGPHVKEGSPAQNARSIKAPVLMFHGDQDMNVRIGESRLMRDKLKDAGRQVELVEFKGLDHYLDDDTARVRLLDQSDMFLRTALGIK